MKDRQFINIVGFKSLKFIETEETNDNILVSAKY